MISENSKSAIDCYRDGEAAFKSGDYDKALAEFVTAVDRSPEITEQTDVIGKWHDCMFYSLKVMQAWFVDLSEGDADFKNISEKAYSSLKSGEYEDAAMQIEDALSHLPQIETEKCRASLLAQLAMALFGQMIADFDRGASREVVSQKLASAFDAQKEALDAYPEVKLTYRMRPR